MEGDRGKYTKDPVKVRFTTKADGRKSISFEIYQNGKRTYERLPNLFLLVETDDNSIRKNRATLNKVEKLNPPSCYLHGWTNTIQSKRTEV